MEDDDNMAKKNMKRNKRWAKISVMLAIIGVILIAVPMIISASSDIVMKNNAFYDMGDLDDLSLSNAQPLTITSLDPEDLDQSQTTTGSPSGLAIGKNPNNGWGYWALQTGYDNREPITGFQVLVSRIGVPTEPLAIGFMSGKKNPADPTSWIWWGALYELPEEDVDYWVGADFSSDPIEIDAGETWYLTLVSDDQTCMEHFWSWGGSPGNQYTRGQLFTLYDGGWGTGQLGADYDTCFRIYTTPGENPPPEEPVINIAFSNWTVISEIAGLGAFLGAAISALKYGMIL